MYRMIFLFALLLLTACGGISDSQLSEDVRRIYPGCDIKDVQKPRPSPSGDTTLVSFSYTCKHSQHTNWSTFKYGKAINTGFTSYCCVEVATSEDLR